MAMETNNPMQCSEFDSLLSDALDLKLTGEKLELFQSHARSCQNCGPLLTEAEQGQRWLKSLEDAEPPAQLVNNILAATTGLDTVRLRATSPAQISWLDRIRDWAGVAVGPMISVARQPRFAMSFAMVFFSLSISLSLAGVKLSDLSHIDLRPSAVRHSYYETSGRIVKYYENIRFVYQMESKVREFKRATAPAAPAPVEENRPRRRNDNTSEHPGLKEDRNYSQGPNQVMLASCPQNRPVAIARNTYRRLS